MGIVTAFIGEVVAIAGYMILFTGVYKLFQIATELGEIKQLLKDQSRSSSLTSAIVPAHAPNTGLGFPPLVSSDDASEYAEKLLRAVNAESQHAAPESPVAPESR